MKNNNVSNENKKYNKGCEKRPPYIKKISRKENATGRVHHFLVCLCKVERRGEIRRRSPSPVISGLKEKESGAMYVCDSNDGQVYAAP